MNCYCGSIILLSLLLYCLTIAASVVLSYHVCLCNWTHASDVHVDVNTSWLACKPHQRVVGLLNKIIA